MAPGWRRVIPMPDLNPIQPRLSGGAGSNLPNPPRAAKSCGTCHYWQREEIDGARKRAAILDAIAAADIQAPAGGGVYSQGWIAGREAALAAIYALIAGLPHA